MGGLLNRASRPGTERLIQRLRTYLMRITGDTILLEPMTEQDIEAVHTVWLDYRYTQHSDSSKARFLYVVNDNNSRYDPTFQTKNTMYLAIRLKDSEIPIGYTVWKIVPQYARIVFKFTILLQEYREHGIYSEMNILRHKFAYQNGSPINESWVRLVKNRPRQEQSLASLYTSVDEELDLVIHGKMHWSHISRDDWEAWINHENQAAKRNAAFILE